MSPDDDAFNKSDRSEIKLLKLDGVAVEDDELMPSLLETEDGGGGGID